MIIENSIHNKFTEKEQSAIELHSSGEISKASIQYELLINEGSENYIIYYNYAEIKMKSNDISRAISLLQSSRSLSLNSIEPKIALGKAFQMAHMYSDAKQVCREALDIDPNSYFAHLYLGSIYYKQGKLNKSIKAFQKAVKIKPTKITLYITISQIYIRIRKINKALKYLKLAYKIQPKSHVVLLNLSNIYTRLNLKAKAIDYLDKAILLKPHFAKAHFNKANLLHQIGLIPSAIDSYKSAIKYNFDFNSANRNLALSYLTIGEYQNGLPLYEFRSSGSNPQNPHYHPKLPKWHGKEPLKDTSLLLVTEQGLGDTIQFVRYVKVLLSLEVKTSLCLQPQLLRLISNSGLIDQISTIDKPLYFKSKFWLPLLSLPLYLGITPANPLITEPYIFTNPQSDQQWRSIFSSTKRPLIALHWQGNPIVETNSLAGRSFPLEILSKFVNSFDCSLISLQKGFGLEQLSSCSFKNKFVPFQHQIDAIMDFSEIASIIKSCDLVITSDSAVAHLSGALGHPTWILLHKIPDWRWGIDNSDSIWYPKTRLFRQTQEDNWDDVIDQLIHAHTLT